MILISPSAAVHLRTLLEEQLERLEQSTSREQAASEAGERGLRILVEKGGCAGMQYAMQLDTRKSGDAVSERDGVHVFVDPESMEFLKGSELDYCDDLVGTGFRLHNPNASRSCGCGTSFEPNAGEDVGGPAKGATGGDAPQGDAFHNAGKGSEADLAERSGAVAV